MSLAPINLIVLAEQTAIYTASMWVNVNLKLQD